MNYGGTWYNHFTVVGKYYYNSFKRHLISPKRERESLVVSLSATAILTIKGFNLTLRKSNMTEQGRERGSLKN